MLHFRNAHDIDWLRSLFCCARHDLLCLTVAITLQFTTNQFTEDYDPTIGFSVPFWFRSVAIGDHSVLTCRLLQRMPIELMLQLTVKT